MKRIIALFAISTLLLAANTTQAQKIAHINVDELLGLMPETQAAEKEMQNYAQQLERDLQEMQEDAQTKYQNLVNNQNNWTQLRITKEQEELEFMTMHKPADYRVLDWIKRPEWS
jgi:outer membrane protein